MKYLVALFLSAVVSLVVWVGFPFVSALSKDEDGRSLAQWYIGELRRQEALDQLSINVTQSLELKRTAIRELMAHRLTLRQVAEQFADADDLIKEEDAALLVGYRKPETEYQRYRQIINWVRSHLGDRSQKARRTIRELEREVKELSDSQSPSY